MTQNLDPSIAAAKLVSLFLGSILYGVYLVSTGICARALLGGGKEKRRKYGLIVTALALFILATIDIVLSFYDILKAVVLQSGAGSGVEELAESSPWINMWKTVNIQTIVLLGDGMLIYRCWIVFSRRFITILLPSTLWLASVACTIVLIHLIATLRRSDSIINSTQLSHAIIAFLAITFATNLLTTGMIVWRIHTVSKRTSTMLVLPRSNCSRLAHVMRIVVESGLLYTLFVLLYLITEGMKSTAAFPVSQMMLVVVGIAFNLIIIRVDRGVAVGGTYDEPTAVVGEEQTVLRFTVRAESRRSVEMRPTPCVEPTSLLMPAILGKVAGPM